MNEITVTDQAVEQVNSLLHSDLADQQVQAVRVFVVGGGCNGFQYGFALEDQINEDDHVYRFDQQEAVVVVDPLSLMYLEGAVIDFKQGVAGSYFSIENPNATTSCGCGHSFSA